MRRLLGLGLAAVGVGVTATPVVAIPAFARKYNMPCSACHYPAAPRLNAVGQRFKWAGYRMPNEIGEHAAVEALQNYIAARGRIRYTDQRQDSVPTRSGFSFDDATLFYAGPMLSNWSAFFEFERAAPDELELTAHVSGMWGTERGYTGFRVGNMHWLQQWGLAGFDRPSAISRPVAFNNEISSGLPFAMARNQIGVEGYWVRGNTRISAEVLNGIDFDGIGDEGESADAAKDVALIFSHILDGQASGITAVGYYGTLGRDSAQHLTRLAISANKVWHDNEIIGGYLRAQDTDLWNGAADNTGQAYFLGVQRYFNSSGLTLLGRYDHWDPSTSASNNARSVFTAGAVLPVGQPQYIRFAFEGSLTNFEDSAINSVKKLVAELQINF